MKLSEAAIDAVMGYAIVFLGIALLVIVVVLMGKLMAAKKPAVVSPVAGAAPVPPIPEKEPEKAPGAAGELKLYDTPERDAAMIMAIVADELHTPINELRFISIREVNKK